MNEQTDEETVLKVKQGDIEAFGTLMTRYEKKLLRYGKKFLTDKEDIVDLVHEVFIKAYTNIQSFDHNRKFSSWIYRIAHNEFINSLKKNWRSVRLPFDFDLIFPHLTANETSDSNANETDIKKMLEQCLNQIDIKYREPLVLHYYEDMDYKNIAEILQIPTSTVGVRLKRGKEILKKLINKLDPSYV